MNEFCHINHYLEISIDLICVPFSCFSQNTLGFQGGQVSQITAASGSTAPPKATRPKSVCQWSVRDVQKWLRRQCGDYYHLYSEAFLEQDITGKKIF